MAPPASQRPKPAAVRTTSAVATASKPPVPAASPKRADVGVSSASPKKTPRRAKSPKSPKERLPAHLPRRRLSFGQLATERNASPRSPKRRPQADPAANGAILDETTSAAAANSTQVPPSSASEEPSPPPPPLQPSVLRLYGEKEDESTASALFTMGWMYLNGLCDTPKNREKAYAYFYHASEKSSDAAPYHMAMLQLGVGAVTKGEKKQTFGGLEMAVKNLELAAERGYPLACFQLGVMYSTSRNHIGAAPTPAASPARSTAAATSPARPPSSPRAAATPRAVVTSPGGVLSPASATTTTAPHPFEIERNNATARMWFERAAAAGVELAHDRLQQFSPA